MRLPAGGLLESGSVAPLGRRSKAMILAVLVPARAGAGVVLVFFLERAELPDGCERGLAIWVEG